MYLIALNQSQSVRHEVITVFFPIECSFNGGPENFDDVCAISRGNKIEGQIFRGSELKILASDLVAYRGGDREQMVCRGSPHLIIDINFVCDKQAGNSLAAFPEFFVPAGE